jgi:hypothetical protein
LETQPPNTSEVADSAIRCLEYLYDVDGVFVTIPLDQFDIDISFDPTFGAVAPFPLGARTGFIDALETKTSDIYMLLAGIRHLYQRDASDRTAGRLGIVEFRRRATEYVLALYNGLPNWASVDVTDKRRLHDASHNTELFRRIPAFLELAELQVVTPLKTQGAEQPAATEVTEEAEGGEGEPAPPPRITTALLDGPRRTAVARVVNHLNCFGRYYTEEYLQFLHEWTGVAAVVELMASLENPDHRALIDFLDFERSFVDGTAWVVPFAEVFDAQIAADKFLQDGSDLSALKQFKTATDVRMPASGVHVEATPGQCILPKLPGDSSGWPLPPAYPWTAGSGDFQ